MTIPTEVLNLQDNNVPDRLLQRYLNNFSGNKKPESKALVETEVTETTVEETVEEGKVEAIQLSTTFSTGYGKSYDYHIADLKDIVRGKPTYIKITRTPLNGELVVKRLGQNVVLQAGDVVETSML